MFVSSSKAHMLENKEISLNMAREMHVIAITTLDKETKIYYCS